MHTTYLLDDLYSLDFYRTTSQKLFRGRSDGKEPVLHQEICPICGRKNVNLYLKDKEWKCKKCCDAEGERNE